MASASAHVSRQRLKRGGAGGDRANFAPQDLLSRAPLVPYWGAHNSHGEGSVGKDLKRLCSFCSSASLGDRVARIVGSLFLSQNLSVTALMSRAERLRSARFMSLAVPRIFHYKRPETTSVCLSRPLFNLEPRIRHFAASGPRR